MLKNIAKTCCTVMHNAGFKGKPNQLKNVHVWEWNRLSNSLKWPETRVKLKKKYIHVCSKLVCQVWNNLITIFSPVYTYST